MSGEINVTIPQRNICTVVYNPSRTINLLLYAIGIVPVDYLETTNVSAEKAGAGPPPDAGTGVGDGGFSAPQGYVPVPPSDLAAPETVVGAGAGTSTGATTGATAPTAMMPEPPPPYEQQQQQAPGEFGMALRFVWKAIGNDKDKDQLTLLCFLSCCAVQSSSSRSHPFRRWW